MKGGLYKAVSEDWLDQKTGRTNLDEVRVTDWKDGLSGMCMVVQMSTIKLLKAGTQEWYMVPILYSD